MKDPLVRYRESPSGCWEWTGPIDRGYGYVAAPGNKHIAAYRVFYEHHVRPLKKGEVIHHTCHNRSCVNPEHLEAHTHSSHGREHGSECCPKCGANHWWRDKRGWRRCYPCALRLNREWRRKKSPSYQQMRI